MTHPVVDARRGSEKEAERSRRLMLRAANAGLRAFELYLDSLALAHRMAEFVVALSRRQSGRPNRGRKKRRARIRLLVRP